MAKIKLGAAPATFKSKVTIPTLDGETADIVVDFKYRNKVDYAIFTDSLIAKIKLRADEDKQAIKKKIEVLSVDRVKQANVDTAAYVLDIAEGWDLEDEFNQANVERLDNEYPGAALAIRLAYEGALLEGRVKN